MRNISYPRPSADQSFESLQRFSIVCIHDDIAWAGAGVAESGLLDWGTSLAIGFCSYNVACMLMRGSGIERSMLSPVEIDR